MLQLFPSQDSPRLVMASATLRDVLEAVPSLGEEIALFNELIPGVPVTAGNLKTLFEAMKQREYLSFLVTPSIEACYRLTNGQDDELYDEDEGPRIGATVKVREGQRFLPVEEETFFDFDAVGFFRAVLWVKETIHCVTHDRICKCDGSAQRAPKRRKLANMDLCFECFLRAAALQA
jgi:hypothetical protein